jgi:acyl-CoA thioesterase-2
MSLEEVMSAVEASAGLVKVADAWEGPNIVLPGYRRLFGGQLLAQAVAVARAPGKVVRSLHLVFTAEGRPDAPVSWSVDPVHDGRTFATRSVCARQGDRVLATGVVSMHVPDVGGRVLEHSIAPVHVRSPADVPAVAQLGAMVFETRPILPAVTVPFAGGDRDASLPTTHRASSDEVEAATPALDGLEVGPPELAVWMRAPRPPRAGTDQTAHQALLAYESDVTMMVAAMRPHRGVGFGAAAVTASAVTSHTISFHRPVRVDQWLLLVQESPAAAGGRAYSRGDWFDESGAVIASCAQEVLIRVADDT